MFSNDLEKQFGKKFKIVKHPTSFDDNKVVAQYTITEKTETISFTDTLRLNLRGDLKVDASGASDVQYKGTASISDFRTSGASSLKKRTK